MTITALPILIPFILIIVLIISRSLVFSKITSIVGSLGLLILSMIIFYKIDKLGFLVLNMAGWKSPYGITLVIDFMSSLMLIVSSVIVFAIAIYAYRSLNEEKQVTKFYVFFFSLIMGVNGAFITGDVFNLYVWFEVMLISSFVLITFGKSKEQLEGGIKYLALNLLGSLFFLAGLGLLYGKTGTLNMAHLANILRNDHQAILMNTSAILFFIAFGIKAAVFPLFFWLPASYHTANITISSLFAGLLTKVGVYAFIRFFTLFFVHDQTFWHQFLLIVAGFTMIIGGMSASVHYDTRKILSYHIISQIGYMIMGLGIYTPLAIAGAIFFTIHNMIAKTNTFIVAGLIYKLKGSFYLKDVGGIIKQNPVLAILFVIPAFALAGVPPISGFFAKFILIKASIDDSHFVIAIIAVLTALLTLYSMIKIWNEAFLKKQPDNEFLDRNTSLSFLDMLPSIILGTISILMGIFAFKMFDFTMQAADQLIEGTSYINNVLNR